VSVTGHFIARVRERMGPEVDPVGLGGFLLRAIRREDPSVVFVSRVNRSGLRIFRFTGRCGRTFYALVDTDDMSCVTVMPPGFTVPRHGRAALNLEDLNV
jgi:hypothetical protein